MQDQVDQGLVKHATAKYLSCLSGDVREADTLTSLLFAHVGLLEAVLDRLKNSARVTPAEFHGNMLRFLYNRALDCLQRSRLGQDWLPELYTGLEMAAIYRVCLAREDGCYIYVGAAVSDLIRQEVSEAESGFLADLGISRQELDDLVLKYGRAYVALCRRALKAEVVEGLGRLGRVCGLDIARAGSSVKEYQAWSRAVAAVEAKKCLSFLDSRDLIGLLRDKDATLGVLRDLDNVTGLIPAFGSSAEPEDCSLGWFDPPKLGPAEAGLDESDLARLALIVRELDLGA